MGQDSDKCKALTAREELVRAQGDSDGEARTRERSRRLAIKKAKDAGRMKKRSEERWLE